MFGFSLAAAPDEALHSLVARHGMLVGRCDAQDLSVAVFGRTATVLCADNPCGVEYAAQALAFGDELALLNAHTIHPYGTVFATEAHRQAAEAWALTGDGRHRGPVGVMSAMLRSRPVLTFCDRCIHEANDLCGVYPWQRAHQLPGTFVCHIHGNALRETDLARAGRRGKYAFAALTSDAIRRSKPAAHPTADDGRVLLRYAKASARLLGARTPPGIRTLQARFHELLSDFRWERAGSLVAMSKLVPALVAHPCVAPVLRAMDVEWPEASWATALNRLLYRAELSKHPLLVLMLLETIGASLDDILEQPSPAPPNRVRREQRDVLDLCANAACAHVRPDLVAAVGHDRAGLYAECSACGFSIRWPRPAGAGQSPIVLRTCALWDNAIARTLGDRSTSVREVSRRFGASPNTIMRAARRAGVWHEGWKDRLKLMDRARARVTQLTERHRSAWSEHASGATAGVPIKMLPKPAFNAYRWLLRNDRAWLTENKPRARVRQKLS